MTSGRPPVPLLTLAILALGLGASGCLRDAAPPSDPELAEALGLPARTAIYRVDMADRGGSVGLFPSQLSVEPGAVVQFVTRDHRVYAVRFERESLTAEQRAFLDESAQGASPPLTTEGARFVISLEGAPPGVYPFRVESQGDGAEGALRVLPPP